jgi:hypothetical protein
MTAMELTRPDSPHHDENLMVLMRIDAQTLYGYYEVSEPAVRAASGATGSPTAPGRLRLCLECVMHNGRGTRRQAHELDADGRVGVQYFPVDPCTAMARLVLRIPDDRGVHRSVASSSWLLLDVANEQALPMAADLCSARALPPRTHAPGVRAHRMRASHPPAASPRISGAPAGRAGRSGCGTEAAMSAVDR